MITMPEIKRRDFLKLLGIGTAAAVIQPSNLFTSGNSGKLQRFEESLYSSFDEDFKAAERFAFLDPQRAIINVIPKEGKTLDIKLYRKGDFSLINSRTYYGVKDSLDMPLNLGFWNKPEFKYRLEYREGNGKWKATPDRVVKTPMSYWQDGKMEVIFIGDPHTFDDADLGKRVVKDPYLREERLDGRYVNRFLKELMKDPDYIPEKGSEEAKMMNGYCLASTIRQVLANENPDFIVNMGNSTGIGAPYKWKGLGLKDPTEVTWQDLEQYSELFWLREREMWKGITPEIPVYMVLGKHDGEAGYDQSRPFAMEKRKKYFKQPGGLEGGSKDENYFPILWGTSNFARLDGGKDGAMFVVLDAEGYTEKYPELPEDYTLGDGQRRWLRNILENSMADLKFVLQNHVLGGWDRGPDEETPGAHGRGPLHNYYDYKELEEYRRKFPYVEQAWLTNNMFWQMGVNLVIRGLDHIFSVKRIGIDYGPIPVHPPVELSSKVVNNIEERKIKEIISKHTGISIQGKDDKFWLSEAAFGKGTKLYRRRMYDVCVGSTKDVGEEQWWNGDLWHKFYGDAAKGDFWGPSGYTKLTIERDGNVSIEYIRGAYNTSTNLPPEVKVGDTIQKFIM